MCITTGAQLIKSYSGILYSASICNIKHLCFNEDCAESPSVSYYVYWEVNHETQSHSRSPRPQILSKYHMRVTIWIRRQSWWRGDGIKPSWWVFWYVTRRAGCSAAELQMCFWWRICLMKSRLNLFLKLQELIHSHRFLGNHFQTYWNKCKVNTMMWCKM